MAFRDLVTGGAGCSVPGDESGGASSSSNPLGSLANSLLGTAAKTQERVRELPTLTRPGDGRLPGSLLGPAGPAPGLPGAEAFGPPPGAPQLLQPTEFLDAFHGGPAAAGPRALPPFAAGMPAGFEEAWGDAAAGRGFAGGAGPAGPMGHMGSQGGMMRPPVAMPPGMMGAGAEELEEFDRIFAAGGGGGSSAAAGAVVPGPSPAVSHPQFTQALHSFFDVSRGARPFMPPPLPADVAAPGALSHDDSARVRNRSSILARHVFAHQGEGFADAQVDTLLHALGIPHDGPPLRHAADATLGGRFAGDFEGAWKDAATAGPKAAGAGLLAQQPSLLPPGESWAQEFEQQLPAEAREGANPADSWATEFGQEMRVREMDPRTEAGRAAAMQQAQRMVDTLSQDSNPKFQNSKFLEFVSKMSRGEIVAEDGQVKPGPGGASAAAAGPASAEDWAAEFDGLHHNRHADREWADEFLNGGLRNSTGQAEGSDWASEFGNDMARGMFSEEHGDAAGWVESYDRYVEEQLKGELDVRAGRASQRWSYQFADHNPYVGHPDPMQQGRQLLDGGLLSEAVLALEAEVLRDESNAEAWRLLGTAHAENDDDRQAIAAMARARDAEPTNLGVLLALGVSHTNELEQAEALSHMRGWLQSHPKYSSLLTAQDASRQLTHSEVVSLFTEAARMSPDDADVQEVLGVLFNLSREFDRAKEAFGKALQLRPRSHALWNRFGATQANNAESAPAIAAYQKALDIKPNYVRAWTNMGIAFANQGKYEESVRYYVRALSMNPTADNAWQYLRIALSCSGRTDALSMCDAHDIDALQKSFPL